VTARVFTGARTISEDFASVLSESATRIITGFRGASENLASSITDSILKVAGRFASISENPAASISGAVTRLAVLARVSPADLSSLSGSTRRGLHRLRGNQESL